MTKQRATPEILEESFAILARELSLPPRGAAFRAFMHRLPQGRRCRFTVSEGVAMIAQLDTGGLPHIDVVGAHSHLVTPHLRVCLNRANNLIAARLRPLTVGVSA